MMSLRRIGLVGSQFASIAASEIPMVAEEKRQIFEDEAEYVFTPTPRNTTGRSQRQLEKRAAKQAAKDQRRKFRHAVDKQNKINQAMRSKPKSQQAQLSAMTDEQIENLE
ncbi:hypothetical protein SHAb15599_00092 [Acinetobacter phage SH-Ab 15599]|nr:hypothetical protein SHAb15599_00092 [Acinetobacter phage SH-Ab 15599]